ncbi:hypothetical protein GY45DRAFT_1374985 [Cubamyces sp. BRFM 1775]|nr:hypothetical protein GY45DRAFT_1374985 [Cubamyces sp. BRFM 1775]
MFIYFERSCTDSLALKGFVTLLWVLDTLHLILVSHTVYIHTITNFGNWFVIWSKPTWSVFVQIIIAEMSDGIIRA